MSEQKPKPGWGGYAWYEAWQRVLTSPSIASFLIILDDPRAGLWRALRWLFLSSLAAIMGLFVIMLVLSHSLYPEALPPLFFIALVYSVVRLAGLMMNAFGIHLVAWQVMGSRGRYGELMYAFASFNAPLDIVEILLVLLTQHPIFFFAIRIYRMILTGMAIRTVYKLSPFQAFLAELGGGIVAAVLWMLISNLLGGALHPLDAYSLLGR